MKRMYKTSMMVALMAMSFVSCELDNYDGPDATIHGSIVDVKDGSPVQQDISGGTRIIYKELGFADPEEQSMICMVNGEYRNNMVFSGKYDIYFNESNFVKPEKLAEYPINAGDNELNFSVQPYIRVSKVTIAKVGNEIVATFTITPTVDNNVKTIGLFGHIDRIAGNQYAHARVTQDINAASKDTPTVYTLKINTDKFKAGEQYYFRVGGVVDVPNAKYNYAPSVRLTI